MGNSLYVNETTKGYKVDQSDIKYIIELLKDGTVNKDWDIIEEAKETLKEFIDSDEPSDDT